MMRLIAEKLGKNEKSDRLKCQRADGSQTQSAMPRQGTLPHDLVHYVVESALPLRHGFLSQVAAGAEAAFVMQALHDKTRAVVDTEAVQAEAVVEALQAQLWSGAFDPEAFLHGVRSACAARGQPPFEFAGENIGAVLYETALELDRRWQRLPYFQSLSLEFSPGPA